MSSRAVVLLLCLCAAVAHTQGPVFEVASIKPSAPETPRGGGFGMSPSGLFQVQGLSLMELVSAAYTQGRPFYRFQVAGGPDWLDSARFDITASSSFKNATPAQTMAMVKAMLIERFKLVAHEEMREGPIYVLALANKNGTLGPKMRKSSLNCPEPGCDFKINPRAGTLSARGLTVDRLAFAMGNFPGVGRIIADRTGLAGGYDMDMEWMPGDEGVSIFTALREQLGLALEASRGPVPMLIIERAEKPSGN